MDKLTIEDMAAGEIEADEAHAMCVCEEREADIGGLCPECRADHD